MSITVYLHLFTRFLIGVVLLSSGISKLLHFKHTLQGIQEYQVIPDNFPSKLFLSQALSIGIPLVEVMAALGLLSGYYFILAIIIGSNIFLLFNAAIIINLQRGRYNLSCHCAGILGSYPITWKLVIRNSIFLIGLIFLLIKTSDTFTINYFLYHPYDLNKSLLNIIFPTFLFVGTFLFIWKLINHINSFLH